ncbi:hypothetical protein BS78_10G092200 [Paspalum vaginatum]|nr:hypothetical protein BS78_10G092200 [Paspalum vaginatum]
MSAPPPQKQAAAPSPSPSSSTAARPPHHRSRFGDTTLTKVFVGGLAWETPSEGLRQHFERYGDILEAVVIADRLTGRSKGYGFVTFREPEAARRAVQEPNPTIAGRRANCNIASLGPPRPAQQQPRGTGRGLYLGPQLQGASPGPHFVPRAPPPQMLPQHGAAAVYHPSHFGYWYPPDFQYQQALMQNYYAQLYGLASPTASPYHQYVGYMAPPAPTPRAILPPAPPPQQVTMQPLLQHPPTAQQVTVPPLLQHPPAAQIQGPFFPAPLPHNFRLQLPPPQAISVLPAPSTTESQPADRAAASSARATSASGTPGA